MITKFQSADTNDQSSIEFEKHKNKTLSIRITDQDHTTAVQMDADQLFQLIGQLLNIQSQFKTDQS